MKYNCYNIPILFLLILTGCLHPNPPNKPAPPNTPFPPTEWKVSCKIRPIIIYKNKPLDSSSEQLISNTMKDVNLIYTSFGLSFNVLPAIYKQDSNLYNIETIEEWNQVVDTQRFHYINHKEILIHFVNTIPLWKAAGIANYPSNKEQFQFGIAISNINNTDNINLQLLSHEIGHYFNVKHPWEDNLADTFQIDINQGCDTQPCLIMNYCYNHPFSTICINKNKFTPMEKGVIQHWALSPPRINSMTVIKIPNGVRSMQDEIDQWTSTNRTSPEIN